MDAVGFLLSTQPCLAFHGESLGGSSAENLLSAQLLQPTAEKEQTTATAESTPSEPLKKKVKKKAAEECTEPKEPQIAATNLKSVKMKEMIDQLYAGMPFLK